jgi:hypothetical protein
MTVSEISGGNPGKSFSITLKVRFLVAWLKRPATSRR